MKTVRAIILRIAKGLLKNLFYLFPIQKKKIVFDSYWGKGYGDNPKYIADEIIRQKLDCKLVWLVNHESSFPENIRAVPIKSIRSFYELATARIIIVNTKGGVIQFFKKKKGQFFLQAWHGDFPLKYIENEAKDVLSQDYIKASKADSKVTDAIISGNGFFSKILRESFWLPAKCKILEYGVPRNDLYFKGDDVRNQLKLKYGFSVEDKILLYAPTFRDDLSTDCYNIEFDTIKTLLSERDNANWKIIVRLHPNIARKAIGFTYGSDVINGSCFSDPQELCMISDCLITDYSSIMSDFMLMGKPIFLYATDYEKYSSKKTGRGLRDIYSKLPFSLCQNQEELENTIKGFDKGAYHAKVQAFMKDYYNTFDDGNASERVVNYLKNQL